MAKETKNTESKAVEIEDKELDAVAGGATKAVKQTLTAENTSEAQHEARAHVTFSYQKI